MVKKSSVVACVLTAAVASWVTFRALFPQCPKCGRPKGHSSCVCTNTSVSWRTMFAELYEAFTDTAAPAAPLYRSAPTQPTTNEASDHTRSGGMASNENNQAAHEGNGDGSREGPQWIDGAALESESVTADLETEGAAWEDSSSPPTRAASSKDLSALDAQRNE